MATFPPIKIRGRTYTFEHLEPFYLNVTLPDGRIVKVRVNFSCHCFAEDYNRSLHTPDLRYGWKGEIRAFCPIRYNQSLTLPALIQSLEEGSIKVFFTRDANYIHIHIYDHNGVDLNYCAFFDLKKATKPKSELVMTVQSAYIKQNIPGALDKIRFNKLVEKTLKGEPITSPRKFQK